MEEILLHSCGSKPPLLCQVLREAGLQVVKWADLVLGEGRGDDLNFAEMSEQRARSCGISRLPAISAASITKELLDSLLLEGFD
jgi:hypothetical protein